MSHDRNHRGQLPSPCHRCLARRDCLESVLSGGPLLGDCERDIWLQVLPGPDWREWAGPEPPPAPLRLVRL